MSHLQKSIFTCTTCGHSFEVSYGRSYKSTDIPSIKEKILSNKLFKYPCPQCKDVFDIEHEFTYHDPERKYIIWLQLPYEGKTPFQTLPPYKMFEIAPKEYKYRIVNTREDLAEKIKIFDANLDDKVIETIKISILVERNHPDFPIKNVYFYSLLSDIDPEEFSDDLGFNVSYYGLADDATIISRNEYIVQAKLLASNYSDFLLDTGEWEVVTKHTITDYEKMRRQSLQEIIGKWKENKTSNKDVNTLALLNVAKRVEKNGQVMKLFFNNPILAQKAENNIKNITDVIKDLTGNNYIVKIIK